ncbi:MAG: hypothetical protein ACLRQF_03510 [Thomasclavelia ramosa]
MTMRLILDYPDYFAAAIPICEALPDDVISDQQLSEIKRYLYILFILMMILVLFQKNLKFLLLTD